MERRALLAAVLCLLVLVAYQEAMRYLYPAPSPIPAPAGNGPETPTEIEPSIEVPAAPAGRREPAPTEEARAAAGRIVRVETELYTAEVATGGGRLVSIRLKHYRAAIDETSEALEMIEVAPEAAAPLGIRFLGEDGKVVDDTTVAYAPDHEELTVSGGAKGTLALTGTLPSGARVEKRLEFSGDAYPIALSVRSSLPPTFSRIGVGWRHHVVVPHGPDPEAHYRGAVLLVKGKVVHELATSLVGSPQKQYETPVAWAGYGDHYFLAALIAEDPAQASAVVSPESGGVQVMLSSLRLTNADDEGRFTLYVGPKDVDVLASVGHQLERAVDFGWFAFLAVPLLRLLKIFHGFTRNYGIDVILLTVVVKVLFIPLSNKSMKSMRDMQRLQPQMAKLREKFKDDRERLNKEMIELYRRHRVNPLGGCLPMLLQFPVFIGLYQALNQSIELRHARFGFWIRDLSTHECYPWPGQTTVGCNDLSVLGVPIPLLVVLMGGSMILQQWLSPSTGMDPAQQRMMMILMPVMFTVMFVNFPSGLVLYWLVNNLLTIAQQSWANRATT